MDYEIYIGFTEKNRKKTYLVFPYKYKSDSLYHIGIKNAARKHFKVNLDHIEVQEGYLLNDELFLDYRPKGSKLVTVAYWL